MSSAIASSYEDTLRSMRTGKSDGSPLSSLKNFMSWGRPDDVLPVSGRVGDQSATGTSILSWPPWASSSSSQPPFYDTFGLTIVQRPGKFVVPYCFANMFLFISFGFLHGFYSYVRHLFSSDRWPYSALFLGSTIATLYVSWWLKMYALTIPMAIFQFVTMGVFVVSYLPGGTSGISMMGSLATNTIKSQITGF